MTANRTMRLTALAALTVPFRLAAAPPPPLGPLPDQVTLLSADGQTKLVGYVFPPEVAHPERVPAVVMMHGRAGGYSSLANGRYDASTLSQRHQKWGYLWAQQGYLALLVDGTALVPADFRTALRQEHTTSGRQV
jgi:carboxymethylenebutenolidase